MNNQSTVYLNKVFSDLKIHSCPLMSSLTASCENFDQQLTFFDPWEKDCDRGCECGCSCGCGGSPGPDLTDDLNFVIDSTEVIISDFDLADPASISPCNVTVNGIPVDAVDFFNERYMAATNDLMTKISDCACIERGLSTKAFFLISCVGGFRAKITVVLRGSVFGHGVCKNFKLLMSTKDNVFVNIPGQTTFAVSELCLPCTTGGIAPIINFSFSAKANLLNPVICIREASGLCSLQVNGCLVAEPIAEVQVTRQTLFRTDAQSVNVPCDELARCRQLPGVCGEEDDDSGALQVRGRCCTEENGGSGCGCGNCGGDCSGGSGCEAENNCCICGCSSGGTRSMGNSRGRQNSISFQFNGRNGCSF